jgi:hypothetical protein
MTGDYVQNAMGRDTEQGAARDLAALINRIGFDAPLGVFATEGDGAPRAARCFGAPRSAAFQTSLRPSRSQAARDS